MRLFAGVDGGQSGTQAVIGDESGQILARGGAGPADEVGESTTSTRLRNAISDALANALRRANLPLDAQFDTVVAGISGYLGTFRGVPPEVAATRFVAMHDAPIAHAGALGGKPGTVVIAGTGSVAYTADDATAGSMHGGWGYLFGDEGSALWIVKSTIVNAIRHERCNGVARLCAFFGRDSLRDLVEAFYRGDISRERLASFAKECIAAARDAERTCECMRAPVFDAANELARLARSGGEGATIAFVGGLVRDPWFRALVHVAARDAGTVVLPAHDPAVGALILAYRLGGAQVEEIREA